jgi:spore coat polysaccharide biosynthesis predicted glycosyltransferase SpsG
MARIAFREMSLLIYADGDKTIGLGHLTRMCTLVRRLGKPARVVTQTPEFARKMFSNVDADILAINEDESVYAAIEAASTAAQLVVMDPPYYPLIPERSAGSVWQPLIDRLRKAGKKVIRFTDEETPTSHRCDVLVNGYPGAEAFHVNYVEQGMGGLILAGPRYFLIDPSHEQVVPHIGGVFVSVGGSDQNDLLVRYAPALRELARSYPVEVVTGPISGLHPDDVPGAEFHTYLSPEDMAAALKGARLAFTACGNTLFERLFHGTPGISVAQFVRQDRYGQEFERLGLTRHLGLGNRLSTAELLNELLASYEDDQLLARQRTMTAQLDIPGGCRQIIACAAMLLAGEPCPDLVRQGG